jgi:hypothetical protein
MKIIKGILVENKLARKGEFHLLAKAYVRFTISINKLTTRQRAKLTFSKLCISK